MKFSGDVFEKISSNCLGLRVRKLDRIINRIFDHALAPYDLTLAQFSLLAAIGQMRVAQPSMLSRVLLLEKSSLSRNLERLNAQKWIRMDLTDAGRVRSVSLSNLGLRTLEDALTGWKQAQSEAVKALGADLAGSIKERVGSPQFGNPDGK